MRIPNILTLNDWRARRATVFSMSMSVAWLGSMRLGDLGLNIPGLTVALSFLCLIVLPGQLLLRVLGLHRLGNIETVVYGTGLSALLLMLNGLILNAVLPVVGIPDPITFTPLIAAFAVEMAILCILTYLRDWDYEENCTIDLDLQLLAKIIFISMIPLLAVVGTISFNSNGNNSILLLMIGLIAVSGIIISTMNSVGRKIYPAAILCIGVALLLHSSLVSPHLIGCDIQIEYFYAKNVQTEGAWHPESANNVNSVLSIVMLAPVFSSLSGISLVWTFKTLYPILFALVPLALFRVIQRQSNDRLAFMAMFFFVSYFAFYVELVQLARVEIAELFLSALVLALFDPRLSRIRKPILLIAFGFGLAVSHYGLAFVFAVMLVAVLVSRRWSKQVDGESKGWNMKPTFVLFFVALVLAWYMNVTNASAFGGMVYTGNRVADNFFSEFMNPRFAQGAAVVLSDTPSIYYDLTKYFHVFAQTLILVGVFCLAKKRFGNRFQSEFIEFSRISLVIAVAAIVLPNFAGSLGTQRFYQFTLLFLTPSLIVGALAISDAIRRGCGIKKWRETGRLTATMLAIFLAVFLLFNSGFVYEVAGDRPFSTSLNSSFDYARFTAREVAAAEWMGDTIEDGEQVYMDDYRYMLLTGYIPTTQFMFLTNPNVTIPSSFPATVLIDEIPEGSIIFLGTYNLEHGVVAIHDDESFRSIFHADISNALNGRNVIFSNGGAQIIR